MAVATTRAAASEIQAMHSRQLPAGVSGNAGECPKNALENESTVEL